MKRPVIAIVAHFPLSSLDEGAMGRGAGQQATWLPQLAQAWQEQRDFDIHWCIPGHKVQHAFTRRQWGQTFHLIPTISISAGMVLARWPLRLAFRKLFRQLNPALIHCWGTENLLGSCLDDHRGPTVLSMQGVVGAYFKTGDLKGWRWRLFKHWEPRTIRNATVITSESQWGIDRVREIIPGKPARRIEYGVHPGFYEVKWDPDPSDPHVLVAGALNQLKGTDILIRLLAARRDRKWRIVFAGTGYLEPQLKALGDPRVELLGMLNSSELQARMSRAWALVHPARADTSPNVVKEARVVGLPVIGSTGGGHAEYIKHGSDGIVVDSEEPEAWNRAIEDLTSSIGTAKNLGAANHEHYRSVFQPGLTAREFLALYSELLPANP